LLLLVCAIRIFLQSIFALTVFIATHGIGSNAFGLDEVPLRFIKKILSSIFPFIYYAYIYLILPIHLDPFLLNGRSPRWLLL
jgi:hypothetical protein